MCNRRRNNNWNCNCNNCGTWNYGSNQCSNWNNGWNRCVCTVVEPGMVPGTMGVAAIDAAAAGITAILGIATTVVVRLLRLVIIAPAVIADKCLSS